jgi:hypothetical protein
MGPGPRTTDAAAVRIQAEPPRPAVGVGACQGDQCPNVFDLDALLDQQ